MSAEGKQTTETTTVTLRVKSNAVACHMAVTTVTKRCKPPVTPQTEKSAVPHLETGAIRTGSDKAGTGENIETGPVRFMLPRCLQETLTENELCVQKLSASDDPMTGQNNENVKSQRNVKNDKNLLKCSL